jgi:hypothetical protein
LSGSIFGECWKMVGSPLHWPDVNYAIHSCLTYKTVTEESAVSADSSLTQWAAGSVNEEYLTLAAAH